MPFLRRLLLVLTLASVAATAAQAQTIPTRWHEYMRVNGKVAMTFNTRAITINGATWAISGSFKNNLPRTLKIVAPLPGIAVMTTPPKPDAPYRFVKASSVTPPFPKTLAPGQVWRGTFRGSGIPAWARYLSAVYGDFEPIAGASTRRWRWITDNAIRR